MSDELDVLKMVAQRLDAAGIAYMVTGSTALNYYAIPRMTRDIDIVVELSRASAERLYGAFQDDFYIDRDAVLEAVIERHIFNIIHKTFVIKVDFVVRKESDYRREEFSRRRQVTVEGCRLSIVAPEDLIISKLDWAKESRSEMQLGDVRNLLNSVSELDRQYLEHWIRRLGLEPLYREVLR